MRILLWSELFWPYLGGAEVFMAELGAALLARGHEVAVLTSHDGLELPDRAEHRGLPIHRLPLRAALRSGDPERMLRARRAAATLRSSLAADVTLLVGVDATALFELQTRPSHPAPLLSRLNQELLPSHEAGKGTLLQRVLAASDWVASVSQRILEQAVGLEPEIRDHSSVVYTGYPAPSLAPAPLPDPPRLLCLGRLVPNKGFDLALEAFAKVASTRPDLQLCLAGDGAERESLLRRTAELGLDERVVFRGWVEPVQVPELLNKASLVLMPSRKEGLPSVAIQAAWMGRPVLCSDAGGLPEIVLDGETGLVVPTGDAGALAGALERMLSDPASAAHMSRAAQQRARKCFGWETCVDAYESLLQKLVG